MITVTLVHHPGDYNGDGIVDRADYDVWLAAKQTNDLAADGNYDGKVDAADLVVWERRQGTRYDVTPEPSTCVLACVLALVMVTCRLVTPVGYFRIRSAGCAFGPAVDRLLSRTDGWPVG